MESNKTIFITGATGVMGFETLKEFVSRSSKYNLRLLVRKSKKNIRKLRRFSKLQNIHIEWGDLMNPQDVVKALGDADIVLHIGGMVSPLADHYPQKTMEVNVGSTKNIIDAVKNHKKADDIKVIYIGSVAQTSNRMPPFHWGRAGDPVIAAKFDYYGLSKIKAERLLSESGLKKWVSLRQTGILHKGLVSKASDPISFHVPLQGVLEWVSVEDSARLMVNLCEKDNIPDNFWKGFYNIGGGHEFRLTNYEFEKMLMQAIGCPSPEKVFERNWFATRNFHGQWYEDSDILEEYFHFRKPISAKEYFKSLAKKMPWWVKLAPVAPSVLMKRIMKQVALTKDLGTLDWLKRNDCEEKIEAFFGNRELHASIGDWKDFDSAPPSSSPIRLSHGYDENKEISELNIDDMREIARFRGGQCITGIMPKGDIDSPLEWECSFCHRFMSAPRTIIKGGHWCPECAENWDYKKQSQKNLFLKQLQLD